MPAGTGRIREEAPKTMNYKRLISLFEHHGVADARAMLREHHEKKELRLDNVDLGKLFCECFGWHEFYQCRAHPCEDSYLVSQVMERALTEAAGAVMTTAFQNISTDMVSATILDKYNAEADVFTPLIPEVDTKLLDGEKQIGLTEIGDEIAIRGEAEAYAQAGVGENWIFTPAILDRGVIIPVSWEALFNDRTGKLLDYCRDVGKWGGVNREKMAIDCVVDENVTRHRYNWRGTTIASYNDNTGDHTWDNLAASNGIVDWTDLDTAEQLFNNLLDPFTSEPIDVMPKHLVVTKQNEAIASYILNATELERVTPGYQTSGNAQTTKYGNPYRNKYQLVTSKLLATRMATDTDWFLGDIGALARCMVAERPNTVMAPTNSHEEFHRRIVQQFRFNQRLQYVVVEPRGCVKSTA
jgi:hypothetical protein